jgi:hypothetical protein
MKNLLVLMTILCVNLNASAYGIISVTKSDKGLFGYKDVEWHQGQSNLNGQHGWIGNCQHPGLTACRPPSMNLEDVNDEITALELLKYAENEIDQKNFNGSYEIRVKVDGEETIRVYSVTWQCNNEGNGIINVERKDD